ncbi:MAG: HWE histidine kinase domain-containing protein [Pseudomonadota bacterium]
MTEAIDGKPMNFVTTQCELNECDREPIHQIGSVQGFGGFLKLNSDWTIAHRSVNCADMLGLTSLPKPGTKLSDFLEPSAVEALQNAVARCRETQDVERLFGQNLTDTSALFDCAVHTVGGRIVVEFEPHIAGDSVNHIALIAPAISKIEKITDLNQLCSTTADVVRDMLGYDRVMVYRFHSDESGEVIAESARDDLEPYLGLRYPHTDIPKQARALFKKNRVRIIADVDGQTAAIEPHHAFGNRPLDMTMSALRTSSPIHLRYLRNMGVAATMTLAIVRQGRLWGLIACHHMTPRLPSFSLRTVAESFSQMFSLVLDRMLIDRSERLRSRGRDLHAQLMAKMSNGETLGNNLSNIAEMLKGLIAHDGLSVNIGGEFTVHGEAPTKEEFQAIAPDLGATPLTEAYGTTNLSSFFPSARGFSDRATGALLIPISREPYDYLILWRKPIAQKVKWAGDPTKAKKITPGERLQPRESFAEWIETVDGHSEDWTPDDMHIAEGLRATLLEVILRMSEEVARERSRAQEQQGLLIAELNHRVRNILNLIRSLVSQSQYEAPDVESFASIIGGRIAALASAHNNITQENWAPAPLAALFESEIEAYLTNKSDRFSFSGEAVLVTPEAYTVLALVVHELMTNSVKYGSLCDQSGSVSVHIGRDPRGELTIAWRERGGPPVQTPSRRGFGSTIIERSIPYELKGEATLRFQLTGLEADFVIPKRFIQDIPTAQNALMTSHRDDAGNENAADLLSNKSARDGLPSHALIVEDSMIIALDTEENLRRAGISSIDVASNVTGGLSAIKAHPPELAIVDFNLGSESSLPVIEELRRRGAFFYLATGYSELGVKMEEMGASGLLQKPYGASEIEAVLAAFKTNRSSQESGSSASSLGSG